MYSLNQSVPSVKRIISTKVCLDPLIFIIFFKLEFCLPYFEHSLSDFIFPQAPLMVLINLGLFFFSYIIKAFFFFKK
jgi:hypothetical protein